MPQPLPSSAKAVFGATPGGFALALTGHPATNAEFFPLEQSQIVNAAPQPVARVDGGVEISLKKDENFRRQLAQLNGVLLLGDGTAYEIHAPPGALPAAIGGAPARGLLNLLRFCSLAFLGGMILNLMPCVFPVLFIKGLSLVEASRHHHSRVRAHGLVYALGILVSFWAVVALLLGLKAGGRQLGWGFQFQSPGFIAVMALLLFFLGLSLAGMFEIGLTVTNTGSSLAARHGYAGSFFTGVLAMVVATPCTAPFMGAAIGFALAQSAAALPLPCSPRWPSAWPRPTCCSPSIPRGCAICPAPAPGWKCSSRPRPFSSLAPSSGWCGSSLPRPESTLSLLCWPPFCCWRSPVGSSAAGRHGGWLRSLLLSVIVLAVATPLYALWKFPAADTNSARSGCWVRTKWLGALQPRGH